MFRIENRTGLQALEPNQLITALEGNYVETGLEVSLDEGRTLQVDSGTVVQSGEEYEIDATEVTVSEPDEEPRKDVVYVNSEQEVVIATGGDESKQPSDAERFDTARPSPPSLKDVDEAVSLAVIWVEPEEDDLVEDDLRDRRLTLGLETGDTQNLTDTESIDAPITNDKELANFEGSGLGIVDGELEAQDTGDANIETISAGTSPSEAQDIINDAQGDTVKFLPGVHEVGPIDIPEETTVIITGGASVEFDKDADLEEEDGVLNIIGDSENDLINNVKIVLNGQIMASHPDWDKGERIEGIELDLASECTVTGTGVIKDAPEDGLDIDQCRNVMARGITLINNGGYGIHLGGSSSENIGDQYAKIVQCTAIDNGFEGDRAGFDANGRWRYVTYVGCTAKDNRQNWRFASQDDGSNDRVVSGCVSIDTGSVEESDTFNDLAYLQIDDTVEVNGQDIT